MKPIFMTRSIVCLPPVTGQRDIETNTIMRVLGFVRLPKNVGRKKGIMEIVRDCLKIAEPECRTKRKYPGETGERASVAAAFPPHVVLRHCERRNSSGFPLSSVVQIQKQSRRSDEKAHFLWGNKNWSHLSSSLITLASPSSSIP